MMERSLKCGVSISKDSRGIVCIRLRDKNSRSEFVSLEMSTEDFADALFGLAEVEASYKAAGLGILGKERVVQRRSAMYTGPVTYDKSVMSLWLKENCQEEGWEVSAYLGSQHSVQKVNGDTYLHYSVVKYVDVAD